MSEQEIRDGLRVAVWDEPPLDFDPDALIAKAEKVRTRRRALVSVGVGTALVVVSAFALPTLFSPSRPESANVAESPTRGATVSSDPSPQQRKRVADQAMARLHDVLPTAREIAPDYFDDSRPKQVVPLEDKRFDMFVTFTDDIGPTAIQVQVGTHLPERMYCSGLELCRQEAESDGSKVIIAEHYLGSENMQSMVTHVRTDGTAVTFSSFSFNPTTGSGYRKTVPIDVGGLRVLATDPQISWD